MTTALAALHMGGLHAHEQLFVLLIAFGPFVAAVVVIRLLRRRDLAREHRERAEPPQPSSEGPPPYDG